MGDYISREAAITAMDSLLHQNFLCVPDSVAQAAATAGYMDGVKDADIRLRSIPAADVVEAVRCKDCKYSEHWYRDKRLCSLWYGEEKPSAPIDVFDDGFCNYGERREDDD